MLDWESSTHSIQRNPHSFKLLFRSWGDTQFECLLSFTTQHVSKGRIIYYTLMAFRDWYTQKPSRPYLARVVDPMALSIAGTCLFAVITAIPITLTPAITHCCSFWRTTTFPGPFEFRFNFSAFWDERTATLFCHSTWWSATSGCKAWS